MKKKKVWMKTSLGLIGAAMALGFTMNGLQEPLEVGALPGDVLYESGVPAFGSNYVAKEFTINNVGWYAPTAGNSTFIGWNKSSQNHSKTATLGPISNVAETTKYGLYQTNGDFLNAGKIEFHFKNYDAVTGTFYVWYSVDKGATWQEGIKGALEGTTSLITFDGQAILGDTVRFALGIGTTKESKTRLDIQNIKVYEGETAAALTGLTLATPPSKTSYSVGEAFDPTDMVISATFSDGSSLDVTDQCIFTPNPITAGTTKIIATFEHRGVTKTVEQPISIATIAGVKVIGDMAKKAYVIGETWDVAGLNLEITYDNGKTDTMPLADTNPTFSAPTVAEGATSVTISGEYFGHPYSITVNGIQTKASDYRLIEDCANLYSGMKFIIGAPDVAKVDSVTGKTMIPAAGAFTKDYYAIEEVETIATGAPVKSAALSVFTLEGTADNWALKTSDGQYLNVDAQGDFLQGVTNKTTYKIFTHAASNRVVIQDTGTQRCVAYNVSSPRFKPYANINNSYPAGTIYALPETDNVLAFIGETMRMGDTGMMGEGTGACISSSYYANAKNALSKLTSAERLSFQNDEGGKYTAALARYVAWANAAGDRAPFDGNAAVSASAYGFNLMDDKQDRSVVLVTSIGFVGAMVAGCYLYYRKKKAAR